MRSALGLLLLFSCAPAAPTYSRDVAPLLEARCTNCHVEGGVAPFALDTYARVKPQAAAIAAATHARTMPPWRAVSADVAYVGDPSLTQEQIDLLAQWSEAGAPEGDPRAGRVEVAKVESRPAPRADLTLELPEAYTPTERPDDYRCFPVEWPLDETRFITGFNAEPGAPNQVHHIVMFLVPPSAANLPRQWDAEEPGPGYRCFGGPYGNRPQQFPVNLVAGWVPGYPGVSLREGSGIEVPPKSLLVVQMHYNLVGEAKADRTKLKLALATRAERRATYHPLLEPTWFAGEMPIPPGASHVVHQYAGDPRNFFRATGSPLQLAQGFNIEGLLFHMHKLGVQGQVWLEKSDGRRIELVRIDQWDFHWQFEYHLKEPQQFLPGDRLRLRCTFDNSQGTREVNWGEGSDDEMCVANLLSSELPP